MCNETLISSAAPATRLSHTWTFSITACKDCPLAYSSQLSTVALIIITNFRSILTVIQLAGMAEMATCLPAGNGGPRWHGMELL